MALLLLRDMSPIIPLLSLVPQREATSNVLLSMLPRSAHIQSFSAFLGSKNTILLSLGLLRLFRSIPTFVNPIVANPFRLRLQPLQVLHPRLLPRPDQVRRTLLVRIELLLV
jgi:hypothetical protein